MATVPVKQLYTKIDRKPYYPKTALAAIIDKNGNDAQNVIDALQDQIQSAASGAILDGSVTVAKLSPNAKVGSLEVTECAGFVKLDIKDGMGSVIATDNIELASHQISGVVLVDQAMNENSKNPVQNKIVKAAIDEVNKRIDDLDYNEPAVMGKYVANISQTDGLVSKLLTAFDEELSETSKNAPQTKVVNNAIDAVNTRIDNLNVIGVLSTDGFVSSVMQSAGKIYVDNASFASSVTSTGEIAPTSGAVYTALQEKNVTAEKLTTATTGSAYTYDVKQNSASVGKIELPIATTTAYGEVKLDDQVTETTKADGSKEVTSTNAVSAKAMAEYVMNKLGDLVGAMTYMGVVNGTNALPTTYSAGATFVVSEEGTYAGYTLRIGDMLIANGDSDKGGTWSAVKPTPKVENKDVTLVAGTKATIATIDGKDITLTPQTIDSALSDTSENAVQNKVIKEALKGINDAIEALDLTSTGGTGKMVKEISQTDGQVSVTAVDVVTPQTAGTDDYAKYQIGDSTNYIVDAKVKLTKETTPTTGSYSTYTLKQGATEDDVKVEIPDFAEALANNTATYSDTKIAAIIDAAGFTADNTLV